MARRDAAGGGQAGVVGFARAEEDFVVWVILREEGFEIGFEAGIGAVQGLEQRERRRETGAGGECGERLTPFAQVAGHGPQHDAGEDRGGDEAEDSQAEEDVGHAGSRISQRVSESEAMVSVSGPAGSRDARSTVCAREWGAGAGRACGWARWPRPSPTRQPESARASPSGRTRRSSASGGSSLPCARASAG